MAYPLTYLKHYKYHMLKGKRSRKKHTSKNGFLLKFNRFNTFEFILHEMLV